MENEIASATVSPDSAAVFASALSLWQACQKQAADSPNLNLSECFNGLDQLMREVMRVANHFETWACLHIDFNEFNDVWPYFLEDKFGETCLALLSSSSLAEFGNSDCLKVAIRLRLPITPNDNLPLPIDVTAANPVPGSPFHAFKIQTVRDSLEDRDATPFLADDDPFDGEFGAPYCALYGWSPNGEVELIANRRNYIEASHLAQKLAPGIVFPNTPTLPEPQISKIAKD